LKGGYYEEDEIFCIGGGFGGCNDAGRVRRAPEKGDMGARRLELEPSEVGLGNPFGW